MLRKEGWLCFLISTPTHTHIFILFIHLIADYDDVSAKFSLSSTSRFLISVPFPPPKMIKGSD